MARRTWPPPARRPARPHDRFPTAFIALLAGITVAAGVMLTRPGWSGVTILALGCWVLIGAWGFGSGRWR